MAIVVNREVAGDLNKPSAELLKYCINEHQKTLKELELKASYYDGQHDILNRVKKDSKAPNNKIVVNHAKYIVDMNVGFTVGNPIAYVARKDGNIEPILDEFERIDIISHDTELEKDLSTFGYAYELIYLKKDKRGELVVNVKVIDPRGVFLVTDDTIDKNPLFAVHYQPVMDLSGALSHYIFKYYNDNRILTYKSDKLTGASYDLVDGKQQYFGGVQVIEYRNNEEKQGDFEQAMSLIDAYNLLQSDSLNDKEAFVNAILFLMGFTLSEEAVENLDDGILQTNGVPGADVDAKYLTKTFDEASIKITRESLLDDIHKISYVPNLNDENFAGNVSGESMKYKLFGLLQLLAVKSRYFIKGLRQRLDLFEYHLNIEQQAVDVDGTKIKINPNLPINTSDIIEIVVKAYEAGILPLKTLLSWIPDIDNPDDEMAMLLAEKLENIELQKRSLGESAPSHNENEEVEKEEDN